MAASNAFETYSRGEFETCRQYLEQIQQNLTTAADVKVTHNILINDYFKAGCADPRNLLTLLTQAYERARGKEKIDKGERKKEEEEDGIREDDALYVLRYNQALLCVQLRHYGQARQILEELFKKIELIDDFLAIKICFLLLEVVLLQKEPDQALQILNFLEQPNAFQSLLKPERKPLEAPRSIEDEEEVEGEHIREEDEEPAEAVAAAADIQQPEKPEGPLPSLVFGACLQRHGRAPDAISPIEFRFTCLTYKIRIHILCRSLKSATKECKNAEILEHELQHAPLCWKESQSHEARGLLHDHDQAKVTCLKAYLAYAKQNHAKAFRLLMRCSFNFAPGKPGDKSGVNKPGDEVEDHIPTDFHLAQDDACSPLFYNNIGCMHFMMHKPNLAIYYFNKALSASGPTEKESMLLSAKVGLTQPGMAASRHWLDRRAEITFNAGLQFLMTGRPAQAYKSFIQCTFVFRYWPRLWMRLAECCIELYRQSQKAEPEGGSKPGGMQSWNRA
ncbi:CNOT10 [Symbiodinium sp. CCMP2592]|nr:CNOT10 [Symbiodinium sp. CCMP2592]